MLDLRPYLSFPGDWHRRKRPELLSEGELFTELERVRRFPPSKRAHWWFRLKQRLGVL